MSTDAVRAALAELVAATNPDGETSVADWRKAWAAATAALSEPAPGDVAQWLASVDADGYRTDEDEGHGVAREAFERAMAKAGYHLNPDVYRDGTYRDTEYRAGWEMWQAASDPAPPSKPAALDVSLDQSACELLFTMLHPSTPDDEYSEIRLQLGDGHSGYGLYVSAVEYPEDGAELVCAAPAPAVDERTANSDSVDLVAASNGSPGGAGWVTVLPDGSAFSVFSFPLPKDHWMYAPLAAWDSERDDMADTPHPILTNAQREAVVAAARYAIRGATMRGQEPDFDPDALVQNFCYALCGPARGAVLPADRSAAVSPEADGQMKRTDMDKDLAAAPPSPYGHLIQWLRTDVAHHRMRGADTLADHCEAAADALDQMHTAIAAERAKADALRTVMIAAAEEIAAHWDAHCDAEGYGPQNLIRRLEEGIPSEYGYTAGRFAELQAELSTLRQQLAEAGRDAKRYRWLRRIDSFAEWNRVGHYAADALDAANDAAIAAQGEAKPPGVERELFEGE